MVKQSTKESYQKVCRLPKQKRSGFEFLTGRVDYIIREFRVTKESYKKVCRLPKQKRSGFEFLTGRVDYIIREIRVM